MALMDMTSPNQSS